MTVLTSELDPGTAAAQDNRGAMLAAIERIGGLAGQILSLIHISEPTRPY